MGVHLRAGWVARDIDVVGDPESIVGMQLAVLELYADGLQAKAVERCRSADRKQELVALDIRRVGQLDDVSAVAPGPCPNMNRANPSPDVDAIAAKGRVEGGRAARMVLGVDPLVR